MDAVYVGLLIMKIIAGTILLFLLGTMFVSLFHLSMGMGMMGDTTDCPFMSHEETVCPMNLADHIGAWKDVFLSVIPGLTLILAAAVTAIFVAPIAPNLLLKTQYTSPPLHRYLQIRTYTFSYRPLQELFSNGILNPKLY